MLVDRCGERSFLTDPGASRPLSDPQPAGSTVSTCCTCRSTRWPAARSPTHAATLIEWAYQRGIAVSIDLSSVSVIEEIGRRRCARPARGAVADVVFANADEAGVVGIDGTVGGAITW